MKLRPLFSCLLLACAPCLTLAQDIGKLRAVLRNESDKKRRSIELQFENRFERKIELEFCICFPYDFYYDEWSLTKFATYVAKRMRKPETNLKMARTRLGDIQKIFSISTILLNIIFIAPVVIDPTPVIFRNIYLACIAALNLLILIKPYKEIRHYNHLIDNIGWKMDDEKHKVDNADASPELPA